MSRQQTSPIRNRLRHFGHFTFDEASEELTKHGIRVRLRGQPLQILAALLRQPGRVVSRDELQQELWKGSTFVDFEHGLNAAMNRLRQALGDSADQPRFVETVPGRGYLFLAPVQETPPKPVLVMAGTLQEETVESAPASIPAVPAPEKKPWPHWIVGAALIGGLLLSYVGINLAVKRPEAGSGGQPLRFAISPPNGYALEAGSSRQAFSLSPDGSRLAFTAMDKSGATQMFIRDLDGLESRSMPNGARAYTVFWAPDGSGLFLTAGGSVRRAALDGDGYQVICNTPPLMLGGASIGSELLISGRSTNYVVPTSGGSPRAIKELYPWPQLLPDGKHLLYTVFDPKLGRRRARVVKYGDPSTEQDLVETDSRAMYAPSIAKPETGYLVFVKAGNILAQRFDPQSLKTEGEPVPVVSRTYSFFPTGAADFSVSNNGVLAYRRYLSRSQLAWVNRQGKVMSTAGPANVNVKQGRISPDGKKIAAPVFDVERGVNDLWIVNTETGAADRRIVGPGLVDTPVWSPDSSRLAFTRAFNGGPPKLFVRGLGESDADEPLPESYFQIAGDWSRDGRFIAFTNTAFAVEHELKGDVWLIDMTHGRKIVHLINTPAFHEYGPAFSPDGRWLAFTSDESGRPEVYVQAFDSGGATPRLTGERHLVSQQGSLTLRWRNDGKELFYLGWDGQVYAVPIALSPKVKIGEASALFSIGVEARAAIHSLVGFDVSTDGQRFLVPIVKSDEKSEIVVIQNWEAGLQRGGSR